MNSMNKTHGQCHKFHLTFLREFWNKQIARKKSMKKSQREAGFWKSYLTRFENPDD